MAPRATVTSLIVVVLGLAWVFWSRVPAGEVLTPAGVGPAPSAAEEAGPPDLVVGDSTVGDRVGQWKAQQVSQGHHGPSKVAHRSDPAPPRAATPRSGNPISHVNLPSRPVVGGAKQNLPTEPPGQTTSKAQQAASEASGASSDETLLQAPNGPDPNRLFSAEPAPSRDPVLRPPSFLAGAPPDYPLDGYKVALNRSSLTLQLQVDAAQGRVVLRLLVLPRGTVDHVNVVVSSGFDVLDRAAVTAASIWRFTPATRDGEPIEAWVLIPVRFVIR